jgi:hypothetical protein
MKQAQADADELIAAYRREQQDAFDKKVLMEGKLVPRRANEVLYLFQFINTHKLKYYSQQSQEALAEMLQPNSKLKLTKISRECKDNSNQMPKRPLTFFSQSVARSVWRCPPLELGLLRSCTATKLGMISDY